MVNKQPKVFGKSFEDMRAKHEYDKYGRLPNPMAVAHGHKYAVHSIESKYGNYDRPINESV